MRALLSRGLIHRAPTRLPLSNPLSLSTIARLYVFSGSKDTGTYSATTLW